MHSEPDMLSELESFISTFGYPIVGLAIMLESMGLPVPGETALLVAAAYAAVGGLDVRFVIIVAAGGAIVGDAAGYWIGRTQGLPFVERHGGRFYLNPRRLARAQTFFERHGPKTVFFGRFMPFLRMLAAFLAGVAGMSWTTFTAYNALGGLFWASMVGLLGYTFGSNIRLLERWVHWLGATTAVLVMTAIVIIVRRQRDA
jgi:membrane protein DedA with SNARE-associated domain